MTYAENSSYPRLRLTRLSNMLERSVNRSFHAAGYDITNQQENILRNLRVQGPMNQTRLAEFTGQDRNSLSRTLAIMEKRGLIEKKICEGDKRYCEIFITHHGEDIHDELLKVLEEWRNKIFCKMEIEELNSFFATSEKLMRIIREFD